MRPTNLSRFRLPTHRLERSVDALIDLIARHWSALCFVAIFAIWAAAMDADFADAIATETAASREAEERAIAQRDEAADWNRVHRTRLVLEGDRESVARMAQQFANLPK